MSVQYFCDDPCSACGGEGANHYYDECEHGHGHGWTEMCAACDGLGTKTAQKQRDAARRSAKKGTEA